MMILEVRDIAKRFGGVQALNGLSFHVDEGKVIGLIGPNGSGKTTVFNIVTGLYRPDKGKVLFRSESITGEPIHSIARRGISRTFQATRLFFNFTVSENIRTVCEGFVQKGWEEKTREVLSSVRLDGKEEFFAHELTSAEQRLLMIAMGLSLSPCLLLLDEPTAGMNAEEVSETLNIIQAVREKGCAVLLIEHNMRAVSSICEHCIVLNYGELIAEGPVEEIRKDPLVIKAYLGEDRMHA